MDVMIINGAGRGVYLAPGDGRRAGRRTGGGRTAEVPVDGFGSGIATVRRAAGGQGSCRLWPRKRRRPTTDRRVLFD